MGQLPPPNTDEGMMNLLNETIQELKNHDKFPEDVRWIGSRDGEFAICWDDFINIANIKYDSGFGSQEIQSDLVVVGDDWWLERHEYDGSECWIFSSAPIRKDNSSVFTCLRNQGWEDSDDE